jgi:hypothetical protein
VEAVDGTLVLDDTPGGGLTATICVPAIVMPATPDAEPGPAAASFPAPVPAAPEHTRAS